MNLVGCADDISHFLMFHFFFFFYRLSFLRSFFKPRTRYYNKIRELALMARKRVRACSLHLVKEVHSDGLFSDQDREPVDVPLWNEQGDLVGPVTIRQIIPCFVGEFPEITCLAVLGVNCSRLDEGCDLGCPSPSRALHEELSAVGQLMLASAKDPGELVDEH